jgi:hypothetical protein
MVDWSFGVDRSRPEAWNLVGRDDAMAAVAANVLTLFSDMMCGCDEDVKQTEVQHQHHLSGTLSYEARSRYHIHGRMLVSRTLK